LCLKYARSSFQEKSSGFDRKEDFTSDFKEDLRFEEALNTKNSKAKENRARHGQATWLHDRIHKAESTQDGKQVKHGKAEMWHGHPMLGGTAVPCGTGTPCCLARPCRRRLRVRSSSFLSAISFILWGPVPRIL